MAYSEYFVLIHLCTAQYGRERSLKTISREYAVDEERLLGGLALLVALLDERLVDVRNDTAASDRGLDQGVELLITADGELQVARRDALDLEVLGGVASELQHLSREVLEDRGAVDGSRSSDTAIGSEAALEEAVDTTDRELEAGASRAGDGLLLVSSLLVMVCQRDKRGRG